MKIVIDHTGEFGGDPRLSVAPYADKSYEIISEEDFETILMHGVQWIYDNQIKQPYKDYKRRGLLALWSPCEMMTPGYFHFDHYDFFTDVYCICPFTCNFMNKHYGYNKFKYIPMPFTNYTIHEFGNYDADCCYFGCLHGDEHIKTIEIMINYKYKFITTKGNSAIFHPYEFSSKYNYPTHTMLTSEEKLTQVSKSKCCIAFNKLYFLPHLLGSIDNRYFNGIENKAFSHFKERIMPQFKSRVMEIASCKSLIICKKDPWNLINDFFIENQEYISFETFDELNDIIKDVRDNFIKYQPIIERAFLKQRKYTVEKILNYIKTNDSSLITWSLKNVE
jgi:hypothetical protein